MKKVVVSQRIDVIQARNETRDCLDHRLLHFIHEANAIGIPAPNVYIGSNYIPRWLEVVKPYAIVLSGGNDIGLHKDRDMTEMALLDYAYKNTLPVLGICRGMQMIATWAGEELKPVTGHVNTRHNIFGTIEREVNSYHNFTLRKLPQGFELLAYDNKGEIEAIKHIDLKWEGWMWHPEREKSFSVQDLTRFQALIK